MSEKLPQIGDTIRITVQPFTGKEFVVIECPRGYEIVDRPDSVWVMNGTLPSELGGYGLKYPKDYLVVKTASGVTVSDTSNVDAALDKQRDDNLRKVFG